MNEYRMKFGESDPSLIHMTAICRVCGATYGEHHGATCPRDFNVNKPNSKHFNPSNPPIKGRDY